MKVIRLPHSKVQLGAPLPWNVRDEHGKLLLSRGHVVQTESQLAQLLQRGAFVDLEEVRATVADSIVPELEKKRLPMPTNLFGLWDQSSEQLRSLINQTGEPHHFSAQLHHFAEHVLALLDFNVEVGIFRAIRQESQKLFYYGYTHAIHTAVMGVLLSRHLGWSSEQSLRLLKAALTMNLSILDLQGQMASQEDPIKDRQRAAIQSHPQDSATLLRKRGITDEVWLAAVAQHHEHLDGTGYPNGSKDMGELAVALRVCDVFMAKISPRAVRAPLSVQEATRQLYREDNGGPMSTAVIKQFGIYPPGDFVKLASGELGIVVQRTANAKAPIVAAITDTAGRPITRTLRHNTGEAGFAIVGLCSDKALLKRLPPERLYGLSIPTGK